MVRSRLDVYSCSLFIYIDVDVAVLCIRYVKQVVSMVGKCVTVFYSFDTNIFDI